MQRKGLVLDKYEHIRRQKGEHVRSYVNRYLRTERACKKVGVCYSQMLDEETRGHKLLSTCLLPQDGHRNILTTSGHVRNFDRIKDAMVLLYPEDRAPPALYDRQGRQMGEGYSNPVVL